MKHLFKTKNKVLNDLIAKSCEAEKLTLMIKQFLDPTLSQHCKVVSFEKGGLTIAVSSAIWATQFRYATTDLINKLRKEGKLYNLRAIKTITEQPSSLPNEMTPSKSSHLSKNSSEIIRQAAKTIRSTVLQEALEKLAKSSD